MNKLKIDISKEIEIDEAMSASFIKHLKSRDGIVIFSPHLDDAVLSMGGLISYLSEHGLDISIVTVFTQSLDLDSPSIRVIMDRAGFSDVNLYFKARKSEDEKAARLLGVKNIQHLRFIDAAWRADNGLPIYPTYQLVDISDLDQALIPDVERKIGEILEGKGNFAVFAPLAIGRHVDHQIVKNAVGKNKNTIYFADFPYSAIASKVNGIPNSLEDQVLVEFGLGLEKKKDAILKYETQLPSFIPFSREGNLTLGAEKYHVPKSLIS